MTADTHYARGDRIHEMCVLALGDDRASASTILEYRRNVPECVLLLAGQKILDLRLRVALPVEQAGTDFRQSGFVVAMSNLFIALDLDQVSVVSEFATPRPP
jgi:hypothetical protein